MTGKFHPSQRQWPSGMPDSIKETTYKDRTMTRPLSDQGEIIARMKEDKKLNLVDVYCPNTGCKWHVRVDEKVREYNLTKHLMEHCTATLEPDWMDDYCNTGCDHLAGEEHNWKPKDSLPWKTRAAWTSPGEIKYVPRKPQEAVSREDSPGSKGYPSREKEELRTAYTNARAGWLQTAEDFAPNFAEEKTSRHPNSALFHQYKDDLGELHDRKQGDYGKGDDPFANVRASEEWGIEGWVGAMVRLNDKVRRLQSLATKGSLNNEAAIDSFMDIAVYSLIARILYEQSNDKR